MATIEKARLPSKALLQKYAHGGHYTDCYSTQISEPVAHSHYVVAFYTTLLFKIERFILKWILTKPSTDEEALQLAEGKRDTFAAWNVEGRADDQLLLCDYQGRTRSWLMVEPVSDEQTRLYFGSAVVRAQDKEGDKGTRKIGFGLLMHFHKLYSVALLYCAMKRLERPS